MREILERWGGHVCRHQYVAFRKLQFEILRRGNRVRHLLGRRQSRSGKVRGPARYVLQVRLEIRPDVVCVETLVKVLSQTVLRRPIDQLAARALIHQRSHHSSRRVELRAKVLVLNRRGIIAWKWMSWPICRRNISSVSQRREIACDERKHGRFTLDRSRSSGSRHRNHVAGGHVHQSSFDLCRDNDANRVVPRPGQRVEHDDPRAIELHRSHQRRRVLFQRRANNFLSLVNIRPVLAPRLFEPGVVSLLAELRPIVAVVIPERAHRVAPGVLAVHQAPLVRLGEALRDGSHLDAPRVEQRVQSLQRADVRPDTPGDACLLGHRHDAVDPGVGHVGADDRQVGILLEDRVAEVGEAAHADLHAGKLALGLGQQLLDLIGRGRPLVVARVNQGQPSLVGPVFGRLQPAAVTAGLVHGQEARAVGPFPPKEPGHFRRRAGRVAADVEEVDARVLEHCRHDPGVRGDVGHFGVARKWHAEPA